MSDEHVLRGSSTDARYRSALDRTAIVAMTDLRGTITFVNDRFCEISGYTRLELLGRNHRLLNSGRHSRSFFIDMFRCIGRGQTWRSEICNRRKDGSIYWVDTTIVPMRDETGGISGYFSIRQDITERKRREEQTEHKARSLEAASEAKSAFVANISHEIRTPLNAILGYTELLGSQMERGSEGAEQLETIRRNGEHLLSVINDVLDISKIEAGRMSIEPIEVMTVELFEEVVSLMQVRADAKGLPLDLEFETDIPMHIRVDPVRLRQVLLNLIGNALKFTEVGGVRIIVGLEECTESPRLRIEIADTGIGMSAEQRDRIFSPFVQADASTTRRFGGTGLGLAISRRLTELMGGDVSVSSVEREGTSFVVRVPTGESRAPSRMGVDEAWDEMVRTRRAREDRESKPVQRSTALDGLRVLVAEDGPDNQRLIAHFLKKLGMEAVIVGDGAQAVDAMEEDGRFDVILMDVQMPVMDGHEATRAIRKSGTTIPIIALTAHAMTEEREAIREAGCDDVESKPVSLARLAKALEKWCRPDSDRSARRDAA